MNSDGDDDANQANNKNSEVLFEGLVKKLKYLLMFNTRILKIYKNGNAEYIDPSTLEVKGRFAI